MITTIIEGKRAEGKTSKALLCGLAICMRKENTGVVCLGNSHGDSKMKKVTLLNLAKMFRVGVEAVSPYGVRFKNGSRIGFFPIDDNKLRGMQPDCVIIDCDDPALEIDLPNGPSLLKANELIITKNID